jgi:hypothetical protein
MGDNVRISVSHKPQTGGIIQMKPVCLREKVLRWLFGVEQKILVLAPADEVEQVEIVKGGMNDDS